SVNGDGLVQLLLVVQGAGETKVSVHVFRIDLDGFVEGDNRLVQHLVVDQSAATLAVKAGSIRRVELDGLVPVLRRFGKAPKVAVSPGRGQVAVEEELLGRDGAAILRVNGRQRADRQVEPWQTVGRPALVVDQGPVVAVAAAKKNLVFGLGEG